LSKGTSALIFIAAADWFSARRKDQYTNTALSVSTTIFKIQKIVYAALSGQPFDTPRGEC
jgi:hypothetical protein